jgi:hypothetical protein
MSLVSSYRPLNLKHRKPNAGVRKVNLHGNFHMRQRRLGVDHAPDPALEATNTVSTATVHPWTLQVDMEPGIRCGGAAAPFRDSTSRQDADPRVPPQIREPDFNRNDGPTRS